MNVWDCVNTRIYSPFLKFILIKQQKKKVKINFQTFEEKNSLRSFPCGGPRFAGSRPSASCSPYGLTLRGYIVALRACSASCIHFSPFGLVLWAPVVRDKHCYFCRQ